MSNTQVIEIAVNLDDVSPEIVGDAQQRLLDAGALDVWTVSIGMKKQRPGVMLCLLCEENKRDELAKLIIELTGSFGVRHRMWHRTVLQRRHETVKTVYGQVRIKIGSINEEDLVAQPEFEDVKRLADDAGVAVRRVMEAAQAAIQTMDGEP
jgi:uncharacterized protein (DUF111 family)